ncbi:MAG: hypothetical protein ACRC5H_04185 [Treponemataceae bacterium]
MFFKKKSSKLDWYYEIRQKDGKTIQRIAKFDDGKPAKNREEAKIILQQKVKEIMVKKKTIACIAQDMYLPHSSPVLKLENLNNYWFFLSEILLSSFFISIAKVY